jgi:uncharacterized membrane protein (UPF0127 family)
MKKLYVTVADTDEKRAQGLMWEKSIGKNEGMLFKFPRCEKQCFWMKNTYLPLDIAFMDNDGTIFQIEEMVPMSTKKVESNNKCNLALEVIHGWFKENDIDVGNKINFGEDLFKKINFRFAQSEHEITKDDEADNSPPLIDDEVPADFDGGMNQNEDEINDGEDPENQPQIDKHTPSNNDKVQTDENINMLRNKIDILKKAEVNGQEIEILYWTLSGHILPPRRIMTEQGKYLIKNGPHGDYLVAFDKSPTISGGTWTIKGNQPKSFIIDNIINLEVIEKDLKSSHKVVEEKRENFWDKLKRVF